MALYKYILLSVHIRGQCRDGMLCLSDDSFSSNDVEQLISFYAAANDIIALFYFYFLIFYFFYLFPLLSLF